MTENMVGALCAAAILITLIEMKNVMWKGFTQAAAGQSFISKVKTFASTTQTIHTPPPAEQSLEQAPP